MKLKFDLGWVFSGTLVVLLVIGGAARLSLAMEAQQRLAASCEIYDQEMGQMYKELKGKEAPKGVLVKKCLNTYKKSTLSIAMDTEKWSYQEIYADALETLNQ